jgi:hypothetical protein
VELHLYVPGLHDVDRDPFAVTFIHIKENGYKVVGKMNKKYRLARLRLKMFHPFAK